MSNPPTTRGGARCAGMPEPVERLLLRAAREVQPLAALTPINAGVERARLTADVRAGRHGVPRWTYTPVAHDEVRRALDAAERWLSAGGAIERLYLARVRELSVEAALCGAAGTGDVAHLSRERFEAPERAIVGAASDLCSRWLSEPALPPQGEWLASDSLDPRSLLSRMRQAVGERRLPFMVVAQPSLASLAATGERVILVAAGRPVGDEDAVRTVLHEVEGHALPRARALEAPIALFRVGTARGTDHQEGRAILLEERAGLLGPRRRRQLAARHRAVEAMLAGASFGDVAATLVAVHGLDPADAVIAAERVFRGGDGRRPGLGRERVYLESFVRLRAHLGAHPGDEHVLAAGQVAIEAVDVLRDWLDGR